MSNLQNAIEKVRDGNSLFWTFYNPEECQGGLELVEVRLNASPEAVGDFVAPPSWELDRVQWGDTLFLRRLQFLKREDVEEMLIEVLEFAGLNGLTLHSWLHGLEAE